MTKPKLSAKKKTGFILLGIVVLYWVAVPVLPFFNFPYKALTITIVLAGGEILFVITVALLGKEYWGKIKAAARRIAGLKPKPEPEQNAPSRMATPDKNDALQNP